MKIALLLSVTIFFYSCVSGQKETQEEVHSDEDVFYEEALDYMTQLEQDLIGEWVNNSLRVWVKTYNKSDTSFIVDITEETWEMKMNIQPIITNIYADGTYESEFRNSFDSLIYKPKGTWMLDGDSLIMEDHQSVYRYQIFIDGDLAEFKSIVDWDKDGDVDDEYFGVQRKNN